MKLGINGGKPVREKLLSYGRQLIEEDDIEAVARVLKSDYLTTGPKVDEFEKDLARYVGSKYAVTFSNGTAALHAACYAAGLKPGDEGITTPLTFAASSNCILYCGAKPIFADIDRNNLNISVESIKAKINDKTKLIIPVDYTGQSVDIDGIREAIGDRDIVIIEDGAHSLGTRYKEERLGSLADMTMFSFHPVKTITTGEGGAITTDSDYYYNRLLSFRSHGITRDKDLFIDKTKPSWYYEQQDLGYNYRMTDIQAALGISQLKKIDRFINRRKDIVEKYNKELGKIEGIFTPKNEDFSDTSNHLYVIRLDLDRLSATRDEIFEAYQGEGIGVNLHYIPVYLHPYYKNLGYEEGLCPNAEEVYKSIITLPLFPGMTDGDVEDVIQATEKIINYYRK